MSSLSFPTETRSQTIIRPQSGWQAINLSELWRYRELLFFLAWRDVKVRYKQTVLGAAWAIIQPVMTMIVFTIFFGRLGGLANHVEGAYSVFVYAALLPWTFFATTVSQSGQSVVSSSNLISKVYFPRLIVPMAAVGGGLVDFAISMSVMFGLMIAFGVGLSFQLLLIPLLTFALILAAVGVGSLLAALIVAYRDFRYVITFLVQLWMFASPVAYPLDVIPDHWRAIYALNPMVGIISAFRSSFLGQTFHWDCILISTCSTLALFFCGMIYFRRTEQRFADII